MSVLQRRFVTTLPGAAAVTVLGAMGALSAFLTDLSVWEKLAGFGFFLGIAIAGAGMLAALLRPEPFGWCRPAGMVVGLLTIGATLLGAGAMMVITREGATEGSDPVMIGLVCAVFGLVLTALGVAALLATTRGFVTGRRPGSAVQPDDELR